MYSDSTAAFMIDENTRYAWRTRDVAGTLRRGAALGLATALVFATTLLLVGVHSSFLDESTRIVDAFAAHDAAAVVNYDLRPLDGVRSIRTKLGLLVASMWGMKHDAQWNVPSYGRWCEGEDATPADNGGGEYWKYSASPEPPFSGFPLGLNALLVTVLFLGAAWTRPAANERQSPVRTSACFMKVSHGGSRSRESPLANPRILILPLLTLLLTFAYRRGVAYLTVNGG